jgi:hypothetical protein
VTDPRIDRRRLLEGTALLGLSAAMGPAGIMALRRTAPLRDASDVHAPRPILPAPDYVTVVRTRRTPRGVPYQEAVMLQVPAAP